jgi:hypothetical protein
VEFKHIIKHTFNRNTTISMRLTTVVCCIAVMLSVTNLSSVLFPMTLDMTIRDTFGYMWDALGFSEWLSIAVLATLCWRS